MSQDFLDTLSPLEIRYVNLKISQPNLGKRELKSLLGCSRNELSKLERDAAITSHIKSVYKEQSEMMMEKSKNNINTINDALMSELHKRINAGDNERLDAKELIEDGMPSSSVESIMSRRIEGIKTKDLIKYVQAGGKTMSQIKKNEDVEEVEAEMVIKMSKRFAKARKQAAEVDEILEGDNSHQYHPSSRLDDDRIRSTKFMNSSKKEAIEDKTQNQNGEQNE